MTTATSPPPAPPTEGLELPGVPRLRPYQRKRTARHQALGRGARRPTRSRSRSRGRAARTNSPRRSSCCCSRATPARGGDAVKCAPTFAAAAPHQHAAALALHRARRRLSARRAHEPNADRASARRASIFLSAEPAANVVGHTASLLLEVDEAQDVDAEKFDREFRPMAATTNATTVLLRHRLGRPHAARAREAGEPRSRTPRRHPPPLRVRLAGRRALQPGVRRATSRASAARLGETHPIVPHAVLPEDRSPAAAACSRAAQRAQLAGAHERQSQPRSGRGLRRRTRSRRRRRRCRR